LAELTPRFEANFSYDFEIDKKKVRILAKPTEGERFLRDVPDIAVKRLFDYRRTAFGWFPILSNLAPLELQVQSCVLRGDAQTVYEIDLSKVSQKQDLFGTHLRLLSGI